MRTSIRRGMLAIALGLLSIATPALAKAPNIVFILTDDQDAASAAQMPLLKQLITDQGTNFRRHYVSLSLCCPSRVATLRGQFAHNSGVYTNTLPDGGFELTYASGLESSTMATWLKDAGYRTALIGKYLNGYPDTAPTATYVPPGWSEWMSPIAGDPHDGFNYTMNINGIAVPYGSAETDYLTDVLSSASADFIRRSVDQFPTQPFFLYVAPYTPHTPATPAPRHAKAFKGIQAPRPSSFNESDMSDKPDWVRSLPLLTSSQISTIDKLYRKRRQSLLAVDDLVQNIVNTLQAKGQLSNTYILYTSDNGFHQGQHRMPSGKNTGFEEDLLIPLMVRGPGVPAHRTVDYITANVDYAPTFAEIAGISTPSFVDGRSILGLMHGQNPFDWRDALLLEHKGGASSMIQGTKGTREVADPFDLLGDFTPNPFVGLRTADGVTYIEYDTGEHEYYDNAHDASQLRNSYNFISGWERAHLSNWLKSLKDASGSALRSAEREP